MSGRYHETRRVAYMRESIDREFASHDWTQHTPEKATQIRELVELRFANDCANLRAAVAQTLDLMTR